MPDIFGRATQPTQVTQVPRYNVQQEQGLNQILQNALQRMQNPSAGFEPIRQQALNTYNQQIAPQLREGFNLTGFSPSSPSFERQLASSGANLSNMLASQQAQYAQNAYGQGLQGAQLGLTPTFENMIQPGQQSQPGLFESLLSGLGPLAGQLLPMILQYYLNQRGQQGNQNMPFSESSQNVGGAFGGGPGGELTGWGTAANIAGAAAPIIGGIFGGPAGAAIGGGIGQGLRYAGGRM